MEQIVLGDMDRTVPRIVLGCMLMHTLAVGEAAALLASAVELGVDQFDHADVYGGGESEARFAAAFKLSGLRRESVFLQSKCGIRKDIGGYDSSPEHILHAVDGILRRLQTDYLDMLLLHRPDALVEPEEVAEAFDRLHRSGKVRQFGVSNHGPRQLALLRQAVRQPLLVNQLQFSLVHAGMVRQGMIVNMEEGAAGQDGGLLDDCRLNGVTIQAWSPFRHSRPVGTFVGNPRFPELNAELDAVAARHAATPTAVAAAWILRHPARMQLIAGTTKPDRLREIAAATGIRLSRGEWYALYRAAGNVIP